MTLSSFITTYIPRELALGRDYTGPAGWVPLANRVLQRFEMERIISLTQARETPVLVERGRWISIPSDFLSDPALYTSEEESVSFRIVNEMIRTDLMFDEVDTGSEFTLSDGSTSGVTINDDDATEDQYTDSALILTDGTYQGDAILVAGNTESVAGFSNLTFANIRATVASSTAGYITDEYLMLRYKARFTGLTTSSSTLPVSEEFYDALALGLSYYACPIAADDRTAYRDEYEFAVGVLRSLKRTPSPEQARRSPIPLVSFNTPSVYSEKHNKFMGDSDAWLP